MKIGLKNLVEKSGILNEVLRDPEEVNVVLGDYCGHRMTFRHDL